MKIYKLSNSTNSTNSDHIASEDELRIAFDAVEYPGFYDDSKKRNYKTSVNVIEYAKEKIIKIRENWDEEFDKGSENFGCATIYGNGGYNRYHCRLNGLIEFDNFYAINEQAKIKAVNAGFPIRYSLSAKPNSSETNIDNSLAKPLNQQSYQTRYDRWENTNPI